MKRIVIKPDGWMCQLKECPPGFFMHEGQLCFKTEYGQDEVYNSSGERFVVLNPMVQPIMYETEED